MTRKNKVSRREFIDDAVKGTITSAIVCKGFPSIVPHSVFGNTAPSNRIRVGTIGTGRISRGHDLPAVLKNENAQVIAVCDLDGNRVDAGKRLVNNFYSKQTGKTYAGV